MHRPLAARRVTGIPLPRTTLGLTAGITLVVSMAFCEPPSRPALPSPESLVDPNQLWDRLFGRDSDVDRDMLATVEISVSEERDFGGRAAKAYRDDLRRSGIRVTDRGRDVEYLRSLVTLIQPRMRNHRRYREIQVQVADSPATDARSFPGGYLLFHRGLIDFAGSEAAMVGVVGHELSHLDHGHQLDRLRRLKLARRAFTPGRSSRDPLRDGFLSLKIFTRPFRPEDEVTADRDGATWAYDAGYDPRELARLFRRFDARDKNRSAGIPSFLRSHPYHADRFHAVQRLHAELRAREPPRKDLIVGRENLKRRAIAR